MSTTSAALVYRTRPFGNTAAITAAMEGYALPQGVLSQLGLIVSSDVTSGVTRTVTLGLVPVSDATATTSLEPGQDGTTGSVVASILLTGVGYGYAAPPIVQITGGGTPLVTAAAQAFLDVNSITVNAGGNAYVSPTVALVGGLAPNGVAAVVTATVVGGVITSFTVHNPGSGYQGVPAVVITDVSGGGTGASGTAVLEVGSLLLTRQGAGYTSAPTVTIVPSFKVWFPDGPSQTSALNNLFTTGMQRSTNLQITADAPVIT